MKKSAKLFSYTRVGSISVLSILGFLSFVRVGHRRAIAYCDKRIVSWSWPMEKTE